jgi:hypothetical protein
MNLAKFKSELKERGLLEHVTQSCQGSAITLNDLFQSQSPPAPACRARLYRWLRDDKGYALARIGRLFNRSHSTVIYALERLEASDAVRSDTGTND